MGHGQLCKPPFELSIVSSPGGAEFSPVWCVWLLRRSCCGCCPRCIPGVALHERAQQHRAGCEYGWPAHGCRFPLSEYYVCARVTVSNACTPAALLSHCRARLLSLRCSGLGGEATNRVCCRSRLCGRTGVEHTVCLD